MPLTRDDSFMTAKLFLDNTLLQMAEI